MTRYRATTVPLAVLVVVLLAGLTLAQELTTGILEGILRDEQGKPIQGATVTVSGPQGERKVVTDDTGRFSFRNLSPGSYAVKAEASGYATTIQTNVEVEINKRTQLPFALTSGKVETVTVSSEAPLVDLKSTTVGAKVSVSKLVNYLPLGRNFSDIFTISPGVVSGINSGSGNYSISGSSGLENAYLVDGVNITNSGYGGIGSYNRRYGSLGSGVTNDFLDEVEVKEGGFEAEFGQATGGVINAVVKSGTNALSGQVSLYANPTSFTADRKLARQVPDNNPIKEESRTDIGLSLGGPIVKDRLFWYGAYNPVETKTTFTRLVDDPAALFFKACRGDHAVSCQVDADCAPAIAPCDNVPFDPAQTSEGRQGVRVRKNDNYAAKVSWSTTPNHRVEATAFGDPSTGENGPQLGTALRRVGDQGFSSLDYGGHNYSLKYAGVLTSNLFLDVQASRHDSQLKESAKNLYEYQNLDIAGGLISGGLGFTPDTEEKVDQYALKLTWVVGPHELKVGYQEDQVDYTEAGKQTGPNWTAKLPEAVFVCTGDYATSCTTNADCAAAGGTCSAPRWNGNYFDFGSTTGAFVVQQTFHDYLAPGNDVQENTVQRSRFSPLSVLTKNTEKNFFGQDTWSITPRWTLKVGLRYTAEHVAGGSPFSLPFTIVRPSSADHTATGASRARMVDLTRSSSFVPTAIDFPKELAPRIGVTWDVKGDGRHKLYANYAKYVQRMTQDLAYRAFSNEIDLSQNWLDPNLTQQFLTTDPQLGSGCPAISGGNTVNMPCQVIAATAGLGGPTVLWPGTKLPYTEEYLLGYSREISPTVGFDARWIHRSLGRIIEDFSYVPEESIHNTVWGTGAGFPFDPYPQYPVEFFGDYVLANIGDNTAAAVQGQAPPAIAALYGNVVPNFQKPKRDYDALEIVLNKRFGKNWVGWASYRYAKLTGNYEGLLRNDNGQDDPNITSLFDFPNTPLMRGQFLVGPLNTDVSHNLKLYGNYQFPWGLNVGAGLSWSSGVPRFTQLVHPNDFYQLPGNGEVPGANPVYGRWFQRVDSANGDAPVGAPFLVLEPGIGAAPTLMSDGTRDTNGNLVFAPYTAPPGTLKDTVLASPVSGNSGFLYSYTPIQRDANGRTPDITNVDVHLAYNIKTGWKNSNLVVILDIFNIFDSQVPLGFDDTLELAQAQANPNFGRVVSTTAFPSYQTPRQFRAGLRWTF